MTRFTTAVPVVGRPITDTLIRRATFGADGEIDRAARELGWDAFLERQLHPSAIDDQELDRRLCSEFPELRLSAKEVLKAFEAPARRSRSLVLLRAVYSKCQLFERMVDFWNDHFSIDVTAGECRVLKTIEDSTAIRAHALGRFRDLLEAVTKSAAMLEYLDNRKNLKAAPNENFARELLELHTLGVGEYDESDVRDTARCFTGWTMVPRQDSRFGDFVFDAAEHDESPKVVLGTPIPANGGEADGQLVLDLVACHPATAQRIARKLCQRFISESPPCAVVKAVALAFTNSDGDLRETLRVLFRSEYFTHDPLDPVGETAAEPAVSVSEIAQPKFVRPFHLVVALLRATRANIEDAGGLIDELADLGDAPFSWPTPDGPPDDREWWESSLLSRWRFAERYARQEIAGVSFDIGALTLGSTPEGIVNRLDECLMHGRMSAVDRAVLQARAEALTTLDAGALERLLTLAACSPSFQVT